jgi:hypothetical protein
MGERTCVAHLHVVQAGQRRQHAPRCQALQQRLASAASMLVRTRVRRVLRPAGCGRAAWLVRASASCGVG